MDTALPQKFPFVLDRNLAKANFTENQVCTSCDSVVLGSLINLVVPCKKLVPPSHLFELERVVGAEALHVHGVLVVGLALVVARVHLRRGVDLHLALDVVGLLQVLVQLKHKYFILILDGIIKKKKILSR